MSDVQMSDVLEPQVLLRYEEQKVAEDGWLFAQYQEVFGRVRSKQQKSED